MVWLSQCLDDLATVFVATVREGNWDAVKRRIQRLQGDYWWIREGGGTRLVVSNVNPQGGRVGVSWVTEAVPAQVLNVVESLLQPPAVLAERRPVDASSGWRRKRVRAESSGKVIYLGPTGRQMSELQHRMRVLYREGGGNRWHEGRDKPEDMTITELAELGQRAVRGRDG